jgi:hypothetical protein
MLGTALAHEHLAIAQQDLRIDHSFALGADAAGQLPEDRRAIDFREGEEIDEKALKALFRSAIDLNVAGGKS